MHANGSHAVGLDPRPYDTTSSGSEKQIGAMRAKQQVLDKWRLDQRNPVYGTEVSHWSKCCLRCLYNHSCSRPYDLLLKDSCSLAAFDCVGCLC